MRQPESGRDCEYRKTQKIKDKKKTRAEDSTKKKDGFLNLNETRAKRVDNSSDKHQLS